MPQYERVGSGRTFLEVVKQIKESVLQGELKPGMFLPSESELTQQFGVSRTVIREALRTLEQMGLCKVVRGARGGAQITLPSSKIIAESLSLMVNMKPEYSADIVEARRIIEPEVAALAAVNATPAQINELEHLLREMEDSHATDVNRYIEADLRSHIVIAHACDNFILDNLMMSMSDIIGQLIGDLSQHLGMRKSGVIHHHHIAAAIRNHDPDAARVHVLTMLSAPLLR